MEDIWKDLTALPSDPLAAAAAATAAVGAAAPPLSWLGHQESSSVPYDDDDDRRINISLSNGVDKTQTPFTLKIGMNCSKKKRSSGCDQDALERKRKRLMKNRESAVRSRARRQAYTYHLEAKILLLREENAELRKLQQKSNNNPQEEKEKHKLQRTLTAPF